MKHLINISKYLVIAALLNSQSVSASLDIEVTGAGEHQIPISVVQFAGEDQLLQSISPIIAADLQRSGLFRLVDPKNKSPHELKDVDYSSWTEIDTLVIGNVVIKTVHRHIHCNFYQPKRISNLPQ